MIHEIDLPCSDCETVLVERTIQTDELQAPIDNDASVSVAECPGCGARYYPHETLSLLAGRSSGFSSRGDS